MVSDRKREQEREREREREREVSRCQPEIEVQLMFNSTVVIKVPLDNVFGKAF